MRTNPAQARPPKVAGMPIVAGRTLFGLASLALFALSVFWNDLGKPFGPGTSGALAVGLFALHMLLAGRRLSPLDPLVWVPVAILLFYFGTPFVIEVLNVQTNNGYDPWNAGNAPFVDRGYCVALFALASLLWGVHLAGIRVLSGKPRRDLSMDRSLGPTALLFTLGALAMVAAGIAIVGPSTVFGLYHEWWDAKALGADQRWIDIGTIFTYSGVFALLATDEPGARWRRWFAYLAALFIAAVAIQKGDRSGLIALGVGAGWCYTQRIGRVRWAPVLAVAAIALILMPVLVEWRAQRSLERSAQASALELLGSSIHSMGSSVNAIIYTVEFVPKRKDYYWGGTFVYAFATAIPNLGLTKGKFFAQGTIEDTPSNWLTTLIAPIWAAQGGGYGFAMAAEWYYNFGFPGVWLGMALVGWALARVRNASYGSSLALIWSATFFAATATWVRNVMGTQLKVALWPIVGLVVIHWLVRALRRRSSRPRTPVASSQPG